MARPLRIELADGLYHVTSRGDQREDIFSLRDRPICNDRNPFAPNVGRLPSPFNIIAAAIIPCRKSRRVSAFIMQMTPIHFSFILLLSSESRIEKNGHVGESGVRPRFPDFPTGKTCHMKIVDSFANTSSMIESGTHSSLRPLREPMSRARGWSHRITPVVFIPAPISDTAKPAVRAKLPPLVIGSTIGVLVSRLKADGETTMTGRVPCCSCPKVGSSETR